MFSLLKRIGRTIKIIAFLAVAGVVCTAAVIIFTGPFTVPAEKITWGVTFSSVQAERLGLDVREAYSAVVNELSPARLRIPLYWDRIEKTQGVFDFSEYDWQLAEAEKNNIGVVFVVGWRTPRWPECHMPQWARDSGGDKWDNAVLSMVDAVVRHFNARGGVIAWQVENEPFLRFFGECKPTDPALLRREVDVVKALDPVRPVIVTDSGELGDWARAASYGDIFGTTMYRKVPGWGIFGKYTTYPLPPQFYRLKANVVSKFSPLSRLIVSELQGEPWVIGTPTVSDVPLEEQYETVNPAYFKEIIGYATKAGIEEVYWWGAEWWYWLRVHGHTEIWETAKSLFAGRI